MTSSLIRRPLSLLAAVVVALPLLVSPVPSAFADGTKEDKIAEREEVQRELEDIRLQLEDVNEDLAETYLELAETELLIPKAQEKLEQAQAALAEAREEDRIIGERLTAAQEEEQRLTEQVEQGREEVASSDEELASVALTAYKGGGLPGPSTVYIGNEEPQDAVDRSMNYQLTMSAQGTRLDSLRTEQAVTENSAERLTAVREEIKQLKIEAEEAVERTEQAEREAAAAKQELEDLYAQQKTQRDSLEQKKEQYKGQQSTLETRSSTLDTEIQELVRQERERAEREAREREERERQERERRQAQQQSNQSSGGSSSGGSSSSSGGWIYPVNARLSSNFGWRVHPIYGTSKLHTGVDFAAACGVPVGAARSGRIIANTYNSSAGNKVVVSHGIINGRLVTTSYHHLQGYAKPVGAQVSAGETVGYVGTSGSSTGCNLHFETHEDGNAVNPQKYI